MDKNIKNHAELVKRQAGVINMNKSDYILALKRLQEAQNRINLDKKVNDLEQKVNDLDSKLDTIIRLLSEGVNV